jgi:hypothetical protein
MSIDVPVLPRRNEAVWLGSKIAVVLVAIVLFTVVYAQLEVRLGVVPLDSGGITALDFGGE